MATKKLPKTVRQLRDLTLGERLIVGRRRKDLSQTDAATRCRVSLFRFRKWEDDVEEPKASALTKLPVSGALKPGERCFLMRRRAGLSLKQVSTKTGITVNALSQIETGKHDAAELLRFWKL